MNLYDLAYALGVGLSSPYWLIRPSARRKVLKAISGRMGEVPLRQGERPAVMIHAVSLGEINATRAMVNRLRELRPELQIIISATTETGHARAVELYGRQGGEVVVIAYPLDFSSAVKRVLDRLRPSAVVLMELEVWPNFILQCSRRRIPVVLVNGRVTQPSVRRYRLVLPVMRRLFRRLAAVCVQEQVYADRFIAMGADADRVRVTGTMKFDTATVADSVEGDALLAAEVGLERDNGPIWVCGATGPGEEEIVLRVYRELLGTHPNLQLVIVPRKPERFDEVASLIISRGFALTRRSKPEPPGPAADTRPIILGDTMGELRKFYSLADVVFVGRTLVDLGPKNHGSDMIEPMALAKPTIVGPYTGNFADVMSKLRQVNGIVEIKTAEELEQALERIFANPTEPRSAAHRAQEAIQQAKGATERHVRIILESIENQASKLANS